MSQILITRAEVVPGTPTYTEATRSTAELATDVIMAPLGIVDTEDTKFYSKRTLAYAATGYFVGGLIVGRKWGGSVPLLNQLTPSLS
jgi:hypothetical protein